MPEGFLFVLPFVFLHFGSFLSFIFEFILLCFTFCSGSFGRERDIMFNFLIRNRKIGLLFIFYFVF